jgi:uncharacterized protein involved in exopolysaccharide biosynthesis
MRVQPEDSAPELAMAIGSGAPGMVDSVLWDPTELWHTVRRSWRALGACGLFGALLALALSVTTKREFTSSAAILPQGRTTGAGLSSLASLAGITSLAGGEAGQGPLFYVEFLGSRYTLREVVSSPFTVAAGKAPVALMDALDIGGTTPALRRERTVDYLFKHLALSSSPKTGVVRISVSLPDSVLARPVVERFVALADRFNLERRQTQARAERLFVERRVSEASSQLSTAEGRLQAFMQQNRDYRAPGLLFEYNRLEREVARAQQSLATLQSAFEQARIEEVRNTPVISVLEPPDEPVRPNSRNTATKTILGALFGALVGLAVLHHRRLSSYGANA